MFCRLTFTSIVVIFLGGCDQPKSEDISRSDDISAIRSLQNNWNQAVETSNVDGYLSVLDEQIELIPTDAPPINGKEGYREMLEQVFNTSTFNIEVVDEGTIEVDGNMAYTRYDYIIHTTSTTSDSKESETISTYRKFLDVMRRQSDGSWKVYKHIWNYN